MIYLNHAAAGVLPRVTRVATKAFVDAHAERGVLGVAEYEARLDEYRRIVGELIGASSDEIAFLRATSDGANAIAGGLDWVPGDEVILGDDEFGANAYPWLALRERGVSIRFVQTERERLTPDALRRAIGPRTRLVAVSWVGFRDGYRHDLAALGEIARAAGSLFVVDAIQALGAFPLDVRAFPCDALYAGGAKWLLALQGISFLYVRAALLDRLKVRAPGWRSVSDIWDFLNYEQPLARFASRYEAGTPNFIGALSLATSVALLRKHDVPAIASHVLSLTDRLCEGLARRGARIASVRAEAARSGIVTFSLDGVDSLSLGARLAGAGICVTYRANGIRVSPHGYNSADEIDALLELLV
ncbi:MAG: aminotransferase class V-fold PLP-dependent enzyme [Candidatus Eremiobacteraeota bacterium]|nr:aminotransferase class V-fold PLP-dependent enzyme [Candidatus Eremiobacteraeota bacterium]